MRAIQFAEYGDSDVLELVDRPEPEPGAGEVRIDVEAVGVNFKDIRQRLGLVPVEEFPFVPGMEAAGTVAAVGPGVDRAVGERVVARVHSGAYAESVVAPTDLLFDVPESLSFAEAAGLPVQFLTAYGVLFNRGELAAGERVLIHAAAGGVGTAAVQLAADAGAEVFGTASTAAKLDLARELGADHGINYTEVAFEAEIDRLTDGEGVDLVLDGVGGDVFDRSLDALAPYGSVVTYGAASGEVGTLEDTTRLYAGNNAVLGFHLTNTVKQAPERILPAVDELSELFAADDLRVVVGETFPLAEAGRAHDHIANRESVGKVVLTT
ncbi:MAG: zinc-binding alcohol dehydrogenase family protein [Halorhabdus sp.]